MKKLLTLLMLLVLSSLMFGQHYAFDAVTQDGSTGSDYAYDVWVDGAGNKYITGKFKTAIDFGNGVIITPVNNYDGYVAKYDKDNKIQWANSFGGYSADEGEAVTVDNDGNVIVAGVFFDTVVFGTDTLKAQGNWDIVIIKYDADGNYVWMKHGYTENQDKPTDIRVDNQGNYIVTGYYDVNDSLTMPLQFDDYQIFGNGERDIFNIKLDPDGHTIWGVSAGGASNDYPGKTVLDNNNNLYIVGYYYDTTATFGTTELPQADGSDVLVAKLNSSGTYEWATSVNGPGTDKGYGIDFMAMEDSEQGLVLITGLFEDSLYAGLTNTLFESAGDDDIFVFGFTNDAGIYTGGYTFGSDGEDQGKTISIIPNSDGDYYVGGITKSDISLPNDTLINYGGRDMIVLRMHQDQLVWAKNYGGSSYDYLNSSVINDDGVVYFAGNFKSSPAQFDPYTLTSKGSYDLWIGQMQDHTVVHLSCNMAVQIANGTFNPAEDRVFIVGDFQEDAGDPNGNWQGQMFELFDPDQNQVYESILNLPSDSGKVYQYLYVMNDETEYVDPRTFTIVPPDTYLESIFFNSDAIPSKPVILAITDIPDDQGGKVRIDFRSSTSNVSYSVWRKMDNDGWDAVGSFNAIQDSLYHYVAPTLGDSTSKGVRWSVFRVSAHTTDPFVYYMSDPDSGYSIDNLAPAVPSGIIAEGYGDKIDLAWDESADKDFQYYAIYRSLDSEFDPDTMSTYTYTTIDNFYSDVEVVQGNTYYYSVKAVDFAGNSSEASEKVFAVVTDVEGLREIPTVYELGQNYPNPFNPSTVITFSLPESGMVSLKVFDILGQEVADLVNEVKQAGVYEVSFDASDLTTGMYIYRIQSGNFTATKKMLLVK